MIVSDRLRASLTVETSVAGALMVGKQPTLLRMMASLS